MREAGLTAKVSSIHVNGWFGDYDKLAMTRRLFAERFGMDLGNANGEVVFAGDSPNDAPMFGFFEQLGRRGQRAQVRKACSRRSRSYVTRPRPAPASRARRAPSCSEIATRLSRPDYARGPSGLTRRAHSRRRATMRALLIAARTCFQRQRSRSPVRRARRRPARGGVRRARSQPRRLRDAHRSARRSGDPQALRAVRRQQGSPAVARRVPGGARRHRQARAGRTRRSPRASRRRCSPSAAFRGRRSRSRPTKARCNFRIRAGARHGVARRPHHRGRERRAHRPQQPRRQAKIARGMQ